MSASNTNLKKQRRHHAGPLIGITLALLVAVGLFIGYLFYTADTETRSPENGADVEGLDDAESSPATPMNESETSRGEGEQADTPDED
ncbi:MAG: hypothetical protein HLUCCA12_12995 [Rhodobacteraceae bacterium HLUCCA12]|nr:MAG: hypothetical protein HLUCCA12_12995 [Rhodobacteraceae bacterium HLUCCA12]